MKQTKLDYYMVDQIVMKYEDVSNKLLGKRRQRRLNNTDFTILSNNCWGGHVYRHYALPYNSPTVGMYFFADEYIRFLENLDKQIFAPLKFITAAESRYSDELYRKGQDYVPIGVLGDEVEMVFLHYKDCEEAYEKWNRRVERVNLNNLIVKFSEQNLCKKKHLESFSNLKFEKKLLLLSEDYAKAPDGIVVKRYASGGGW